MFYKWEEYNDTVTMFTCNMDWLTAYNTYSFPKKTTTRSRKWNRNRIITEIEAEAEIETEAEIEEEIETEAEIEAAYTTEDSH